MHDRFILLQRSGDLTPQEQLLQQSWISLHPMLGEAYRLKEDFFAIYDAHDKSIAGESLTEMGCRHPFRNRVFGITC